MIKFPASAVTLALLGLVFSVPAHPQPLALEGILRSEHQQQALELRRQQDEYRGRKGVQNLSPAKRRRRWSSFGLMKQPRDEVQPEHDDRIELDGNEQRPPAAHQRRVIERNFPRH
jgi:hypothetical protein